MPKLEISLELNEGAPKEGYGVLVFDITNPDVVVPIFVEKEDVKKLKKSDKILSIAVDVVQEKNLIKSPYDEERKQ